MTAPLPVPPTEDDTERVERVARALGEKIHGNGYCEDDRDYYDDLARAALAALHPTEETRIDDQCEDCGEPLGLTDEGWRACQTPDA